MKRHRIKLGDAILRAGKRAIRERIADEGLLWEATGIPHIQRNFQRLKNAVTGKGYATNAEVENKQLKKENEALKQKQQPPKPQQPPRPQPHPAKPAQPPKPSQPSKPAKPAQPTQPSHDDFYDLLW